MQGLILLLAPHGTHQSYGATDDLFLPRVQRFYNCARVPSIASSIDRIKEKHPPSDNT